MEDGSEEFLAALPVSFYSKLLMSLRLLARVFRLEVYSSAIHGDTYYFCFEAKLYSYNKSTKKLENITFIHGDTTSIELDWLKADCIVVNMVLHHTPAPAEIFFDLADVISTDGHLYVTDLCSHDQAWAKESCGDVWLGFAPEDLTQWAIAAGFKPGEEVYLTQRNGFRVQIRQFIKI